MEVISAVRPDGVVYGVGFLILRDDERVEMVAWLRNHYFAQIMRRVDSDAVNQWRGIERKEDFVASTVDEKSEEYFIVRKIVFVRNMASEQNPNSARWGRTRIYL